MNELTLMQAFPIERKEYNGQPVVTFRDIDAIHQKAEGSARKNFNNNKRYFVEGVDFYTVQGGVKNLPTPLYEGQKVFTQTGYLMIVKSFTDDLSWAIQRELVNGYFSGKKRGLRFMGAQVITLREYCEATREVRSSAKARLKRRIGDFRLGEALLLEGANLALFKKMNPEYTIRTKTLWILTAEGAKRLSAMRALPSQAEQA